MATIEKIHHAGWVWNDCKPSNLLVTEDNLIRPIDFEGSYPVNKSDPFDWKTKGFSKSAKNSTKSHGKSADLYALGAVIYFLLTGVLYNLEEPTAIEKLRLNVPQPLKVIIQELLSDSDLEISQVEKELVVLLNLV